MLYTSVKNSKKGCVLPMLFFDKDSKRRGPLFLLFLAIIIIALAIFLLWIALLFILPFGVFFIWKNEKFSKPIRIMVTCFLAIGWIACIVITTQPKQPSVDNYVSTVSKNAPSSNLEENMSAQLPEQTSVDKSASTVSTTTLSQGSEENTPAQPLETEPNLNETSDLFESVYVPYAQKEKPFDFNSIKTFIESTSYLSEISAPADSFIDAGYINVYNKIGDYVYFNFDDGDSAFSNVSFFQASTKANVSFNNATNQQSDSYKISGYSTYSTVSGVDEQRKFLFPSTKSTLEDTQTQLPQTEPIPRENIIGTSNKDINDIGKNLNPKAVHNDTTGNWKYVTISDYIDFNEYALSYYNKYFANNNEIHAVVNPLLKTTTKISVSHSGDMLYISIYEYVDGEENDAKILYSGSLLDEYFIYTDNGDIEDIQD